MSRFFAKRHGESMEISLSHEQSLAMEKMIRFATLSRDRVFTLSGFAGVGKTTVMVQFAREISKSLPVALTAPTNKAVKVLDDMRQREALDRVDCRTIYSLLGLKLDKTGEIKAVNFDRAAPREPFTRGIIVVDEASMVGKDLYAYLQKVLASYPRVKIVFVGDPLQLPPVKEQAAMPFSVFDDGYTLTQIIRQAEDNPIIRLTVGIRACIQSGGSPRLADDIASNGIGVFTCSHSDFAAWMHESFGSPEYKTNPMAYRGIAWRNKAVDGYNLMARRAVFGDAMAGQQYIVGERVTAVSPIMDPYCLDIIAMHTDDEATISSCEASAHPLYPWAMCHKITITDDFGRDMTAFASRAGQTRHEVENARKSLFDSAKSNRREWPAYYRFCESFADIRISGASVDHSNIRPAHVLTSHKSQGSTFDRVFVDAVDILSNTNRTEALKCLYVAVSRARFGVAMRVA